MATAKTNTRAAAPKPAAVKEKARKLSYKEERELEGIEAVIMEKEEAIAALEAQLNDPDFYLTRAADAPAFSADIETRKREVQKLYARWEELESIKAAAGV